MRAAFTRTLAPIGLALALAASPIFAGGCNASAGQPNGGATANCNDAGTLAQAIPCLEAAGKLPVLDRSDDLAGPDADHNGIRDDIDAYIAKQNYTDPQRKAAQQLARSLQLAVTFNSDSVDDSMPIAEKTGRAVVCADNVFTDMIVGNAIIDSYQQLTANTPARVRSYDRYNRAGDGTVWSLPKGNTCDP